MTESFAVDSGTGDGEGLEDSPNKDLDTLIFPLPLAGVDDPPSLALRELVGVPPPNSAALLDDDTGPPNIEGVLLETLLAAPPNKEPVGALAVLVATAVVAPNKEPLELVAPPNKGPDGVEAPPNNDPPAALALLVAAPPNSVPEGALLPNRGPAGGAVDPNREPLAALAGAALVAVAPPNSDPVVLAAGLANNEELLVVLANIGALAPANIGLLVDRFNPDVFAAESLAAPPNTDPPTGVLAPNNPLETGATGSALTGVTILVKELVTGTGVLSMGGGRTTFMPYCCMVLPGAEGSCSRG